MKFEIYQEPKTPAQKPEEPIRLCLRDSFDDGVRLVVVREDGNIVPGGNLLRLSADGTLHRYWDVNPCLGLPLDADGCLMMGKE